jgi:hypothetical protein
MSLLWLLVVAMVFYFSGISGVIFSDSGDFIAGMVLSDGFFADSKDAVHASSPRASIRKPPFSGGLHHGATGGHRVAIV